MLRNFVFCYLVASTSLIAAASESTAPASQVDAEKEMCKKVGCVFDVRVVLRKADGTTFDKTYPTLPVAQPNGVSVYAGQTVLFEADEVGDRLSNFHQVSSVEKPEKTLSASLTQASDGTMNLVVRNPFKRHIKISMGMMPLDRTDLVPTSSCPVVAAGSDFEMWPYPIFQIWLGEMRLFDDLNHVSCSE
jgi:hypothetical protein